MVTHTWIYSPSTCTGLLLMPRMALRCLQNLMLDLNFCIRCKLANAKCLVKEVSQIKQKVLVLVLPSSAQSSLLDCCITV